MSNKNIRNIAYPCNAGGWFDHNGLSSTRLHGFQNNFFFNRPTVCLENKIQSLILFKAYMHVEYKRM